MKRYESYKDSGVQWIGEIPSHWGMVKLKYDFSIYAGATPKTEIADYWDGNIVWITPADYKSEDKFISQGQRSISKKGYDSCNTQLVPKGSLVFSKRAPIGTVAISETELCTNQGCLSCVPKNVNTLFFYYLTSVFTEEFDLLGSGATFKEISANDFSNVKLTLPPLEEQKAIAEWLDVKCGEIDRLIATQQRRIELLQELRKSIITRAVTRGINPDVPLCDSGIDWIGQIPAHWSDLRLRFVCELRNGYTPSKANPDFWENGVIPWYRMEDIRESGRKLNAAKQYITEEAVKGGGLFEAGSFILATTATIGEHALLIVDSLANQRFTNLKIRKSLNEALCQDYFFYYLFVIDEYCKTTTRTATFPAVNMEDLKNFHVVFPPYSEQREIVTYIERETAKVDHALQQAERQIELLQELRQSVITEVVTGKRKVC